MDGGADGEKYVGRHCRRNEVTRDDCKTCRGLIDAYLLGTLEEGERTLVMVHVEDCPDCRESLSLARNLMREVREAEVAGRGYHCDAETLTNIAFGTEQMTPAERAQALEHIRCCGQCRDELAIIRGVAADLGLESEAASVAASEARKTSARGLPGARLHALLLRPLPAVWVGAAAVVAIAAAFLFRGRSPETPPAIDPASRVEERAGHALGGQDMAVADPIGVGSEPVSEGRDTPGDAARAGGVAGPLPVEAEPQLAGDPAGPVEPGALETAEPSIRVGTYLMDIERPAARVFILDLEDAWQRGEAGASRLEIALESPGEPVHLIMTRPPDEAGADRVDVELETVGADGAAWLWPDYPVPGGESPFNVSVPPGVLQDGEYRLSLRTKADSSGGIVGHTASVRLLVRTGGER